MNNQTKTPGAMVGFYEGIGPCIDHGQIKNVHKKGYAKTRYKGVAQVLLHRAVYCEKNCLSLEDIKGLVVRHRCDNTRCINPEHLDIGTYADNMKDAVERDRFGRGESHHNSKMTEEIVIYCRKFYVPGDSEFGGHALARKFGVSQFVILSAVKRRSWTHI